MSKTVEIKLMGLIAFYQLQIQAALAESKRLMQLRHVYDAGYHSGRAYTMERTLSDLFYCVPDVFTAGLSTPPIKSLMTTQEKLKEIRARIKKHHLDADALSESGDESTGYADGKRFAYFMVLVLIEEYFPFLDKPAVPEMFVAGEPGKAMTAESMVACLKSLHDSFDLWSALADSKGESKEGETLDLVLDALEDRFPFLKRSASPAKPAE